MGLKKSLLKHYYHWRLPRERWHLIPVLPDLQIATVEDKPAGSKAIYYRKQLICYTKPLIELKQFKQSCCFIIATGPSIKQLDLSLLQDQCLFAVNGATALTDSAGLNFQLYTVIDPSFARHKLNLIKTAIDAGAHCLFSYRVIKAICDQDPELLKCAKVYLVEEPNKQFDGLSLSADKFYFYAKANPAFTLHDKQRPENTKVGFSKNLELGAFDGGTVAFWATQIAYYIGFEQVFIVGIDLGSNTNQAMRFYENEQNQLPSYLADDYDTLIKPAFECLATTLQQHPEIQFYNLSLTSRLPDTIIPKIDFTAALSLCETKVLNEA